MNRKKKYILIIIFSLIIGYIPVCWIVSQFVWYETDIEEKFEHENRVMSDVILQIWTNPTKRKCRTSFLCPIIKRCSAKGSMSIGLRATDKDGVAKWLQVHEAVLIENDQKKTILTILDPNKHGIDIWFKFHDNAGEWIVNSFNKKKLNINKEFVVQIEVSIEKNSKVKKDTILFPMKKVNKIRKGWVFLYTWRK